MNRSLCAMTADPAVWLPWPNLPIGQCRIPTRSGRSRARHVGPVARHGGRAAHHAAASTATGHAPGRMRAAPRDEPRLCARNKTGRRGTPLGFSWAFPSGASPPRRDGQHAERADGSEQERQNSRFGYDGLDCAKTCASPSAVVEEIGRIVHDGECR